MVEPTGMDKTKAGLGKAASSIGKLARDTSTAIAEQAEDLVGSTKVLASGTIEKLTVPRADSYEEAITDYNSAFTSMNDKGLTLLRQRERCSDLIEHVELLVNSIANTPKSFGKDFDEIEMKKAQFLETEEIARKDLEAARDSAVGAGAGFVAGAAVASMAPSAALWAATTFGTASTGTAISTLSGAAATNAALAWLGGGAVAAGGGGTALGSALIAMAGPVGWTVAGATLLASIVLFAKKKFETREMKQEALTAVKQNTALAKTTDALISDLLQRTISLREMLAKGYGEALPFFNANFLTLTKEQQSQLAALVNTTKACATQMGHHIEQEPNDE